MAAEILNNGSSLDLLENEDFQHLGSVATNHGYSNWATTAIPADVKQMWYRLSRRADDFCIECSTDGGSWSQMRVCHITECAWKAHDGQQPDEE